MAAAVPYAAVEVVDVDYDDTVSIHDPNKSVNQTAGFLQRILVPRRKTSREWGEELLDCELSITHRIITFHICCSNLFASVYVNLCVSSLHQIVVYSIDWSLIEALD